MGVGAGECYNLSTFWVLVHFWLLFVFGSPSCSVVVPYQQLLISFHSRNKYFTYALVTWKNVVCWLMIVLYFWSQSHEINCYLTLTSMQRCVSIELKKSAFCLTCKIFLSDFLRHLNYKIIKPYFGSPKSQRTILRAIMHHCEKPSGFNYFLFVANLSNCSAVVQHSLPGHLARLLSFCCALQPHKKSVILSCNMSGDHCCYSLQKHSYVYDGN